MKATTKSLIALAAIATAILAMSAVALAAPPTLDAAKHAALVNDVVAAPEVLDAARNTAVAGQVVGDAGAADAGDAGQPAGDQSSGSGPAAGQSGDQQPPISVEQTSPPATHEVTRTVETTPTPHEPRHPSRTRRPHLAYTGGDAGMWLIAGAIIAAFAAVVFMTGRRPQEARS